MNILLHRGLKKPQFDNSTAYDNIIGFWGMVVSVNPKLCAVDVRMQNGFILQNVRVVSKGWVSYKEGKHITGGRDLPPIDSYVFCLMPNGEYSSAFVLCSAFAVHDNNFGGVFKGEGADYSEVVETVDNSGWKCKTDNRTGTKTAENNVDGTNTIKFEVNQEKQGSEYLNAVIHGNTLIINKDDGLKFTTDKEIELKSIQAKLLTIGNSVDTLGAMIDSLMSILEGLQCDYVAYGDSSPHKATIASSTSGQIASLQSKWNQVFK